jgi:hypothetical protein
MGFVARGQTLTGNVVRAGYWTAVFDRSLSIGCYCARRTRRRPDQTKLERRTREHQLGITLAVDDGAYVLLDIERPHCNDSSPWWWIAF